MQKLKHSIALFNSPEGFETSREKAKILSKRIAFLHSPQVSDMSEQLLLFSEDRLLNSIDISSLHMSTQAVLNQCSPKSPVASDSQPLNQYFEFRLELMRVLSVTKPFIHPGESSDTGLGLSSVVSKVMRQLKDFCSIKLQQQQSQRNACSLSCTQRATLSTLSVTIVPLSSLHTPTTIATSRRSHVQPNRDIEYSTVAHLETLAYALQPLDTSTGRANPLYGLMSDHSTVSVKGVSCCDFKQLNKAIQKRRSKAIDSAGRDFPRNISTSDFERHQILWDSFNSSQQQVETYCCHCQTAHYAESNLCPLRANSVSSPYDCIRLDLQLMPSQPSSSFTSSSTSSDDLSRLHLNLRVILADGTALFYSDLACVCPVTGTSDSVMTDAMVSMVGAFSDSRCLQRELMFVVAHLPSFFEERGQYSVVQPLSVESLSQHCMVLEDELLIDPELADFEPAVAATTISAVRRTTETKKNRNNSKQSFKSLATEATAVFSHNEQWLPAASPATTYESAMSPQSPHFNNSMEDIDTSDWRYEHRLHNPDAEPFSGMNDLMSQNGDDSYPSLEWSDCGDEYSVEAMTRMQRSDAETDFSSECPPTDEDETDSDFHPSSEFCPAGTESSSAPPSEAYQSMLAMLGRNEMYGPCSIPISVVLDAASSHSFRGVNTDYKNRNKAPVVKETPNADILWTAMRVPSWLQSGSGEDVLSLLNDDRYSPHLSVLSPGQWVSASEDCPGFRSVDVNLGPEAVEWFAVAAGDVVAAQRHILGGVSPEEWRPSEDQLVEAGVPYLYGIQQPGDIVCAKEGSRVWWRSLGFSRHVTWAHATLSNSQMDLSLAHVVTDSEKRWNKSTSQAAPMKNLVHRVALQLLNHCVKPPPVKSTTASVSKTVQQKKKGRPNAKSTNSVSPQIKAARNSDLSDTVLTSAWTDSALLSNFITALHLTVCQSVVDADMTLNFRGKEEDVEGGSTGQIMRCDHCQRELFASHVQCEHCGVVCLSCAVSHSCCDEDGSELKLVGDKRKHSTITDDCCMPNYWPQIAVHTSSATLQITSSTRQLMELFEALRSEFRKRFGEQQVEELNTRCARDKQEAVEKLSMDTRHRLF